LNSEEWQSSKNIINGEKWLVKRKNFNEVLYDSCVKIFEPQHE
jgi:hypothetical protein